MTWAELVGRPKATDQTRQRLQQLPSIVLLRGFAMRLKYNILEENNVYPNITRYRHIILVGPIYHSETRNLWFAKQYKILYINVLTKSTGQ